MLCSENSKRWAISATQYLISSNSSRFDPFFENRMAYPLSVYIVVRIKNIGPPIILSIIIAMMTLLSVKTIIIKKLEALGIHDRIQWKTENLTVSQQHCSYADKFSISANIFVRVWVGEKYTNRYSTF